MMKTILSMAVVLSVCALVIAADGKAVDPIGTWKCEYEIGGQARTSTLKVKKDGEVLSATMSWPDQDATKVKDLKMKESTISFTAERKLPGGDNTIVVDYKMTIDGDVMKGKGSSDFGGEKREWDIQAKRQATEKP